MLMPGALVRERNVLPEALGIVLTSHTGVGWGFPGSSPVVLMKKSAGAAIWRGETGRLNRVNTREKPAMMERR